MLGADWRGVKPARSTWGANSRQVRGGGNARRWRSEEEEEKTKEKDKGEKFVGLEIWGVVGGGTFYGGQFPLLLLRST